MISKLKGISEAKLKALAKSGINNVYDLITYLPRDYVDRSKIVPIAQLSGLESAVVSSGSIVKTQFVGFGKGKRFEVMLEDQGYLLNLVWFKAPTYLVKRFQEGQHLLVFGQPKRFGRSISMAHPKTMIRGLDGDSGDFVGIQPVYPGNTHLKNARITNAQLQKWILQALASTRLEESIPKKLLERYHFEEVNQTLLKIHKPDSAFQARKLMNRFVYEELLCFQIGVLRFKRNRRQRASRQAYGQFKPHTSRFFNELLPFELTDGQKSALASIRKDVRSGFQMNRLIQGDVGAGKTIVAFGAMLMAIDNGQQTALMAPTEILAEQHFKSLSKYAEALQLPMRLLTGTTKRSARNEILADISAGHAPIVIGTHALFQEPVIFNNLGLIVVDEQHRFGVKQRAEMQQKGKHPHMLVMSATPIPRSLAITAYGDMEISQIRDLPAGRKPIRTKVISQRNLPEMMQSIAAELDHGRQVYFVYPLVEESEKVDLKDATEAQIKLQQDFPKFKVGLIHGRMNDEEKENTMRQFIEGRCQILVSTTVIEVGIDVPNATVMVIEHANRFGLSQLHQLRGRVGRSNHQSFCYLISDVATSANGHERLKTLEMTTDGFKIAEADLKLRGPGDFLGTRQSGLPEFKYADILEDQHMLLNARNDAEAILDVDPKLEAPQHAGLKAAVEGFMKTRASFARQI